MQTRPKELDKAIPIQSPMLTTTNYTVWAMRMRVLLRIHKVWESIEPGTDDATKNDITIAMLFQSIPEVLILQVGDLSSPKDIWGAIKTRNLGTDRVKEAQLQTLIFEFERIQMTDSETIDNFTGKLSEIATKALARIKFKEMRSLIGVQDLSKTNL